MSKVQFVNRRFNPDSTPFHDIAKAMAKAFGYTADLKIEQPLAQLIRLRVAQLNNCAYCLILHTRTARDAGIEPAKLDGLGSWWESNLYSTVEKSAFRYCDELTTGNRPEFQEVHDDLAKHFTEREIAEIAAIVINMNVWTRLKLAQGAVPEYD